MSYVAIFLIICESLNVSCTDLVKRCLSCWLDGWGRITSPPSRPFLPTTSRHYISATVTFHLLLLFTFEELLPCIFFLFWSESILGIFPQKRNFSSSKSVSGSEKSFRGQKHRSFNRIYMSEWFFGWGGGSQRLVGGKGVFLVHLVRSAYLD